MEWTAWTVAQFETPHNCRSMEILLRGFKAGIPPVLRLHDVHPSMPAAGFHRHLADIAESLRANIDQVEGAERAFNAAGGLSLTHGLPSTGKSTMVLLQALTAASMGHKVLVCLPDDHMNDETSRLFGIQGQKISDGTELRIYHVRDFYDSGWQSRHYVSTLLLEASAERGTKPVSRVSRLLAMYYDLTVTAYTFLRCPGGSGARPPDFENFRKQTLTAMP